MVMLIMMRYASFRLASLNYWPKLIENINNISSTSKGAFFWDLNETDILQTIDQHQNWGHSVSIKQEFELEKRFYPVYLINLEMLAMEKMIWHLRQLK